MTKKVYLHVGTPKTGTSYLQHVLFHNRQRLGKRVRAPVRSLPGQAAGLVDDRDVIGHRDRIGGRAERRGGAQADVALDHPRELVWAHRADQADVAEGPQVECRVSKRRPDCGLVSL